MDRRAAPGASKLDSTVRLRGHAAFVPYSAIMRIAARTHPRVHRNVPRNENEELPKTSNIFPSASLPDRLHHRKVGFKALARAHFRAVVVTVVAMKACALKQLPAARQEAARGRARHQIRGLLRGRRHHFHRRQLFVLGDRQFELTTTSLAYSARTSRRQLRPISESDDGSGSIYTRPRTQLARG